MPSVIFVWLFAWVPILLILRYWALRRIHALEDLDVSEGDPPGQRLTVDGVSLHYVEHGRGEPLVLIHGLDASVFSWRRNIDPLARHFRVIAVDLLGFGDSQRETRADLSLRAHARRVVLLMDALGIDSAGIAGHSLGGAVAMHLVTQQPHRVRSLILIDAATPRETKAIARTRYWRLTNPIPYAIIGDRGFRFFLRRLYYDKRQVTDDVVAGYWAPRRYRGTFAARERLARNMASDKAPPLNAITAPTLILWGANDPLVPPRRGRWLASRIAGARLVPVPQAGHQTPEEQPDVVNREIMDFASKHARAPGRSGPSGSTTSAV